MSAINDPILALRQQHLINIHCSACGEHKDDCACPLWARIPRRNMGVANRSQVITGVVWALAFEASIALIGWLAWLAR